MQRQVPDANEDGVRGRRDWLDRGLLLVVLLCCGVALSKNYADPDLWGHVTYGRDLLREGLPETTTYSYTASGRRWINHENLSEILLACGADTFGARGLLVAKLGLGLLILAAMLRYARTTGIGRPVDLLVVLLVAANMMHFWSMRPQILSYSLFTLLVVLLNRAFADWNRSSGNTASGNTASGNTASGNTNRLRLLWLAPPLFLIWANTHGAFVAGFVIFAAYLTGRGVEALWRQGRAAVPMAGRLAAVLWASGLITLLNPYGAELHAWLLQSLGSPRPEIIEWRPPELFSIVWIPLWAMAAAFVVGLLLTRRPRDVTHVLLLCATLWQACEHRRHIPFFAILFGFWAAPHVASALERFGIGRRETQPSEPSKTTRWAVGAMLAGVAILISGNLIQQLWTIPVKRNDYPVSAFEFMTRQQLRGNMVVRFKWAQYAIAALSARTDKPLVQVAFDGRFRTCYPQEVVDMYFDFALGDHPTEPRQRSPSSPPVDGSRLLRDARTDLVLIDRAQIYAVELMESVRGSWTLLYQDELAQLWGRSDRYANPRSPDYLPPHQRQVSDAPQDGFAIWPALPEVSRSTHISRGNGSRPKNEPDAGAPRHAKSRKAGPIRDASSGRDVGFIRGSGPTRVPSASPGV